jgi:spore cortex biosynthesis protein YabQ
MSTVNQTYIFLSTVYGGIIIGFIYDLYRMVRRIIRPGKIGTGIIDLLFWLTVFLLSFALLLYVNDGEIRLYHLFGFILGGGAYMLILSPLVMVLFNIIYRTLKRIFDALLKGIMAVVGFLWNVIRIPLEWIHIWADPGENKENSQ